MDTEVTNRELLNDIENFSNFRIFGIGKLSPSQESRLKEKETKKAERKEGEFIKSLTKGTLEAGKVISEPETVKEEPVKTNEEDISLDTKEEAKKFLGMKRGIGIPVAIVGGLVIIGGIIFTIYKLRKK